MTLENLLIIRGVLNIGLFMALIIGAGLCLFSRHNGITKTLGATALVGSLYVAVVIFISFVDVTLYPDIRYTMLEVWDMISGLLLISVILLGIKLVKSNDN